MTKLSFLPLAFAKMKQIVTKQVLFQLTVLGIGIILIYALILQIYSNDVVSTIKRHLIRSDDGSNSNIVRGFRITDLVYKNPEKCQVANLDLNEPTFISYLEDDNRRRGYSPRCIESSWKLFEFDYTSRLVRSKNKTNSFWDTVSCCYIPFERKENSDTEITITTMCYNIVSDEMTLPPQHEFINVQCTKKGRLIYSDLLGFVPIKNEVEQRIQNYEKKIKSEDLSHKKVNVVIFGLDSVSQNNMLRYLPETHNYIMKNLSGIQFSKYHKTAENSFDNMVGFHLGMTRSEAIKACWPNFDAYLDTCPHIWKEFAAKGFRTSYAEDAIPWSIFWYRGVCKGFTKQPTDYDYRTLTRRMEYFSGYDDEPSTSVCYGSKFNHEVVIDNIIRTAATLENKLYFQFSWITAMTHNVPIMIQYIGNSVIKMFEVLKQKNLMNNTVYIFLGDHGMIYGPPAKTAQGILELNLPFFYMIFPEWFSVKYPQAIKNLRRNSKLLTSHFDSHETLKDFLDQSSITDEALARREMDVKSANRGISFFLPIPKDRDCQSAGLMSKYCSCWTLQDVSVDHFLIKESNEILLKYFRKILGDNYYSKCMGLNRLGSLDKSKCSLPSSSDLSKTITQNDYMLLRMDPQCELQFKILLLRTTVYASLKKYNGTWTLLDIKFSKEGNGTDMLCNQPSPNEHTMCDCLLVRSKWTDVKLLD